MDNNYSDSYVNEQTENRRDWADAGRNPNNTPSNINAKYAFMRLGFGVGLLSLISLAGQYILLFAFLIFAPDFIKSIWCQWTLSFVPLYGIALPGMYLVIKKLPKTKITGVKFTKKQWLLAAIVAFGFIGVGAIIGNIVMAIISALTGVDYQSTLSSILDSAPWWQTLLFTVIAAPLGEEFIFRKLLIDRSNVYGYPYAILFSGIMFGLFHGNFYQAFYATLIGFVLAYIYVRTGKYLLCVSIHSLINFVCGFLSSIITDHMDTDSLTVITLESMLEALKLNGGWFVLFVLYDFLIYGCMLAGLVILIVKRKSWLSYRKTELQLERQGSGKIVFGNAGTVCAMVAMGALFILSLIPTN